MTRPAAPQRAAPHLTPAREAEHAAREKRLAAALRENLRRRKQQARAKAGDAGLPAAGPVSSSPR